MKRILLAWCIGIAFSIHGSGTRNLILPIDWGKENIEREFSNPQWHIDSEEFGVITQVLMKALVEKAAPIIVSSATWGNLIARGALYRDAVQNKNMSYLQKYPLFANPQNIDAFRAILAYDYDPAADLLIMQTKKKSNGQFEIIPNPALYYHFAYQLFFSKNPGFKPNEWIVKKLSDYIYLLIPISYVQALQARRDTPMDNQIEYEVGKKENFQSTTPLSPYERLVGMKFEKFSDIPASVLLDMFAHPLHMNINNYKNLAPQRAWPVIQKLIQYKWEQILDGFLFGQHFINVLSQLFVTHVDLKFPGGSQGKTDVNEAYFFHEWLVFLDGHGSVSQQGPVMPVVTTTGGGGFSGQIAFTAGLEQGAFRELLGFLNNQIETGSLFYGSCYSGGPHLFKLFEHHWDYPKTQQVGKRIQVSKYAQAAPDVFNYLIIAANQFYTITSLITIGYSFENYNYWPKLPSRGLEFNNYFKSMARFLHPEPKITAKKNGSKKQKVSRMPSTKQELITTISYVHQFDFSRNYMIPAIRLPYTEWFVSLADLGAQIQLGTPEAEKVRREREEREEAARTLLETKIKTKKVPAKVLESSKQREIEFPEAEGVYVKKREGTGFVWKRQEEATEKERKEKESRETQEKEAREKAERDRKERELFERNEKMRKEQEERAKASAAAATAPTPKPAGAKPPVKPTVLPQAQPEAKKPTTAGAPSAKPPVAQPEAKPSSAKQPAGRPEAAKPPLQPVQPNIPQPSASKPPAAAKPPLPTQLPPVVPPGTKPAVTGKLPPPPQIPMAQAALELTLYNLRNMLNDLAVRLR